MKYLFYPLFLCLFIACESAEEEAQDNLKVFTPQIPGGTTSDNPITQKIKGLEASAEFDRVTLTWINPSIYKDGDYDIHIYKTTGTIDDFALPDPSLRYSSAFLYYPLSDFEPIQSTGYIDINTTENLQVSPGDVYTYHVYIEKKGIFSEGETITVTIPDQEELVNLPSASEFWTNYASKVGNAPDSMTGDIYLDTLSPGAPTLTRLKGQIAYAYNGMVMVISDTDNNRVMIYANRLGLSCYEDFTEGELDFELCLAINANAPLTPYSVLGQVDFTTNYSCQDGANPLGADECFTSPTGITVKDDVLYISDSGNDRVVIYDTFPIKGCYNFVNLTGETTDYQCEFTRVIGKQGTSDLTNYSLAVDGDAALSCPNGLEFHNNTLYIADTCNSRVVSAANANFPNLFDCDSGSWKTSACVFSGVLGQPDLFTQETFRSEYDLGNITYDFGTGTTQGNDAFLQRHFNYPIDIIVTDQEHLIIAANEDFLEPSGFGNLTMYGRLIVYNDFVLEGTFPDCTPVTYISGGCDADRAIGQTAFNRLIMTPFGGNYTDTNYALRLIGGIDSFGTLLFMGDAFSSHINIWEDYTDDTIFAGPSDVRVSNPNGEYDSINNRYKPNLSGIGSVEFSRQNKSLYIMDAGNSSYYTVRIYDF